VPESISNNVKLAQRGELRLLAFCQACGHGTRLDAHYAVRVIEGYTTVEELAECLRCTECRAKEGLIVWGVRQPRAAGRTEQMLGAGTELQGVR
jgi:hypothetical protein